MGSRLMTDKASVFASEAAAAGWEVETIRDGTRSTVRATRPDDKAELSITWQGEACLNECTITIGGRKKKLRNASACRKELSGERSQAKVQTKVQRSAMSYPPDDEEDLPRSRPEPVWGNEHAADPDSSILRSVVGRTVMWVNARTGAIDSATVPAKPRQLRIDTSPITGKRALTFAALGEGFRSVYIDRIVNVS